MLVRQLKRLARPLLEREEEEVDWEALGVVGEMIGTVGLGVIGEERVLGRRKSKNEGKGLER